MSVPKSGAFAIYDYRVSDHTFFPFQVGMTIFFLIYYYYYYYAFIRPIQHTLAKHN
jgi:hypothetical protein